MVHEEGIERVFVLAANRDAGDAAVTNILISASDPIRTASLDLGLQSSCGCGIPS
jgi:hypothetical protein